jgi:hypothetical protein
MEPKSEVRCNTFKPKIARPQFRLADEISSAEIAPTRPQFSHTMATALQSTGRSVGWCEFQGSADKVLKAGDIFGDEDGRFELSLACVSLDGILSLRFADDMGTSSRALFMVVESRVGDRSVEIGQVDIHGHCGHVHFFAFPALDARFIF